MTQSIDARTVHVLARAQGHEWMDEETAGRIAVAATAATAAVAAAAPPPGPVLVEEAAAEFVATLHALAGGES